MNVVPLGELMPSRIPTINPGAFPDEQFTLWSIPSYDAGKPEHVVGRDVGSSKKAVQDGDVLLSKIVPHIRRAWKVSVSNGHRQIASSEWITFRHGAFLSDYIRYFLLTDQFHRQFMDTVAGVGGSLLRAQPKSVAKIGIPLPPLDEQRRIVGLLDRAAEIRRRADAARAKARAIIPALFLDTFGDPATNPKGWKSVALDELCDLVRGSSPRPQGDSRFFGGPVPRLMISDITRDGTYVTPRTDSLTIEGATRSRPMKAGDVVMAVSGAVGLPAILVIDACIHDGFVGFRNLRREVTAQYFYYYLSSVRRSSQSQAVGATFQNLNTDQIRRWIVPIPPEQHQTAFSETANRLESLARHLDAAAAKAEAMAAGLSAEVFG